MFVSGAAWGWSGWDFQAVRGVRFGAMGAAVFVLPGAFRLGRNDMLDLTPYVGVQGLHGEVEGQMGLNG